MLKRGKRPVGRPPLECGWDGNLTRRQARITARVVALFQRAEETHDEDEHSDLSLDLHAALGLKPWEPSPLDVGETGERPHWLSPDKVPDWDAAVALRRKLLAQSRRRPR